MKKGLLRTYKLYIYGIVVILSISISGLSPLQAAPKKPAIKKAARTSKAKRPSAPAKKIISLPQELVQERETPPQESLISKEVTDKQEAEVPTAPTMVPSETAPAAPAVPGVPITPSVPTPSVATPPVTTPPVAEPIRPEPE